MAGYFSLISRLVGSLEDSTVPARHAIYVRARQELVNKLRGPTLLPSESYIDRECAALEEAINEVERLEVAKQLNARSSKAGPLNPKNIDDRTVLGEAYENRPRELAQKIHDGDASPEVKLHEAASSGDVETVRRLLATKVDPDEKVVDGRAALMIAASNGHLGIVQALLAAGVDARKREGATALYEASANGHFEVARVLVAAKADVNAIGPNGETAINAAHSNGHGDIVELLGGARENGSRETRKAKAVEARMLAAAKLLSESLVAKIANPSERAAAVDKLQNKYLLEAIALADESTLVRRAALRWANLREFDKTLLVKIALEDDEPIIRRDAMEHVMDLSILYKIAMEDRDADIRQVAQARLDDLRKIQSEDDRAVDRQRESERLKFNNKYKPWHWWRR